MKDIFLVSYEVQGIKSLDTPVSLLFYKKTFAANADLRKYNIKGIYGINGSGKSAIITSVDIFKKLILNSDYLNDPSVQKNLDELINKKLHFLNIKAEFYSNFAKKPTLFAYEITLKKDLNKKYRITKEKLSHKNAANRKADYRTIYEIIDGEIVQINSGASDDFIRNIKLKMTNLLYYSSFASLFPRVIVEELMSDNIKTNHDSILSISNILFFAALINVYLDSNDDHQKYFLYTEAAFTKEKDYSKVYEKLLKDGIKPFETRQISCFQNIVPKTMFNEFEKLISSLYRFLHIFKDDLRNITIDHREDKDNYICDLIMHYDDYQISSEFESTGIKKLMKLYMYLRSAVNGEIVFIDELDSNLHDVYLCSLLTYFIENGKGQLCFTTHNIGPMDVLKHNKKSIEFLSEDHRIYSWNANGNYNPASLYRKGMVEGSPFNIDPTDFVGLFD